MSQHAWTSFRAQFPEDQDPEESRCKEVGEFLATKLRESGVTVQGTDCWRDCGWEIDCEIGGKNIYCFVTWLGRTPVDYALCCTSDRGFVSWLRGISDVKERWELAREVHRVLVSDPRFADIRWYVESGRADLDEPWVRDPV